MSTVKPDEAIIALAEAGQDWRKLIQSRIAVENRVRNMERDTYPEEMILPWKLFLVERQEEETAQRARVMAMGKAIPFVQEAVQLPGVGASGITSLLAFAGDPLWHARDERLRTSGEWRAVCGMHTAKQGPWSSTTRAVLFTMADSVIRNRRHESLSALVELYDREKERQLIEKTHTVECKRCGELVCRWEGCEEGEYPGAPHPGHGRRKVASPVGSHLAKGHAHARARRLIMSELCDSIYRLRREQVLG